jgi:hypothetical protein
LILSKNDGIVLPCGNGQNLTEVDSLIENENAKKNGFPRWDSQNFIKAILRLHLSAPEQRES